MKITLDTNTVVSGIFWKGDPHKILNFVANGDLENITSKEIFDEHEDVCFRDEILDKTGKDLKDIKNSLDELKKHSKFVKPKQGFDGVKDDPKDNKFLDAAYEGKSEYIVTRDKHLLKLKDFKGIKIVKPEYFLDNEAANITPDFVINAPKGTFIIKAKKGELPKGNH